MLRKYNNKKGISLIVLIITIAIILILAGAVILSVATNRPIESAEEARDAHNDASLEEQAKVLSAQWEVDIITGDATGTRVDYVKNGLKTLGFTDTEIGRLNIDETTGTVTWKN